MTVKAEYPRDLLFAAVQRVIGTVDNRAGMVVLTHLLMVSDGRQLQFTATNLEMQMVATVQLPGPAFGVCVLARKFHDILKALPADSHIGLSMTGERLTLTCNRGRYVLATLPAESFPAFDSRGEGAMQYSVNLARLRWGLGRCHSSMANGDVRYYLNGMHFRFGRHDLRLESSDGHRLAIQEVPLLETADEARDGIMPRKSVQELLRTLPDNMPDDEAGETGPNVTVTNRSITIHWPNAAFSSRWIEGKFPDVERAMPKDYEVEMELDRLAFVETVRRVVTLADPKFQGLAVRLKDGVMEMSSTNIDGEEALDVLDVDADGAVSTAFNGSYLSDALGNIQTDKVRLELGEGAARLRHTGDLYGCFVVMRMRV